ncbi:carboxymuconolactone decarboxylase family protein [Alicyclobacillus tolerans]|uniref:4-carboxymuconolactone decarboxylase n=1 Tax=Alicyclobacillus tolerans TaxID=90970 RepID=A0A1M6XPP2_9BACL|nr:4-carboxymuconolactone decarboxylase [Alicyclobacillus montanus]
MNELTKELIQVAAAVAVGCTSCVEYHVPKARELGASDVDLEEVLALVRPVKLTATMKVEEFAESMFRSRTTELNVVSEGSSCGCGSGSCCS